MKQAISYFIKKAADWIFRKRSPALIVVRVGSGLTLTTFIGSWAAFVRYRDAERFLEFSYHSSSTANMLLFLGFFVGIAVTIFGVIWEYQRFLDERKQNVKKKTIVIEQRGLVDTSDTPLDDFVRNHCQWRIDSVVNDIRERVVDNVVTRPDLALTKIKHLKLSLSEKTVQTSASEVSIAYGGIFPVPFAFFTGYQLDDESKITVYDWDRDEANWRELDNDDGDDEHFIPEQAELSGNEVVLAVSVSYPVDRQAISSLFPNLPVHYLSLPSINRNNHWSKRKQDRLSGEFFEYCKMLVGEGIEHIHLILASQNSVAFRFGQAYDKRNLPRISVYQYERQQSVRYPWSMMISQVAGEDPIVVNSKLKHVA